MVGTNKTNVDVSVAERSTGQFTVGAGFSSLDGAWSIELRSLIYLVKQKN